MINVTTRAALLSSVIFLFLCVTSTLASDILTVELKTGEVLERVECKVNKEYKVLEVMGEFGDVTRYSYHQIARILDAAGNDITENVLGGRYEAPEWESEEERDSLIAVARQKPWGIGVAFVGSFDIPIDDYYADIESGAGFGAQLLFPVTSEIVLRGELTRTGLGIDDSRISSPDVEIDFTATRYLFVVDYLFSRDAVFDIPNYWHVYTGMGAVAHKISVTADLGTGPTTLEDTQTKFTTNFGLGVLLKVSRNVGIDISGEWDILFIGKREDANYFDPYYSTVETASIISFRAAVVGLF